jgi:hypothetical protein
LGDRLAGAAVLGPRPPFDLGQPLDQIGRAYSLQMGVRGREDIPDVAEQEFQARPLILATLAASQGSLARALSHRLMRRCGPVVQRDFSGQLGHAVVQ